MSVIFLVFFSVRDFWPLRNVAARRHFGSAARPFPVCFCGRWAGARARALDAVQETSVISGCRPLRMPGRVAWTGALPPFRGVFVFIFSVVL